MPTDPTPSSGSGELPGALDGAIASLLFDSRVSAFVRISPDGRVRELGGALARHGLAQVASGTPLTGAAPYLVGLLPVSGPVVMRAVQTGERTHADLHLSPTEEGALLLVVDVSEAVELQRAMQQKSNELDLLRAREIAGARSQQADRADVLAALKAMDVVLFHVDAAGKPHPLGELPPWLRALCGADGAHADDAESLLDTLPFLEHFLVDAREHWENSTQGRLRSGVWSERTPGGGLLRLEAIALSPKPGERVLAVQRLEESFDERQSLLQMARERTLRYEDLVREVQQKEVLLHLLVHDLRAPLTGIVGALSLMLSRPVAQDTARTLLEMGLRQARRQETLIRAVLDVFSAQIDELQSFEVAGPAAPELVKVTREVVEQFRAPYQLKGVQLELEVDAAVSPGVRVVGRRDQLERVFSNLLDNALRHSPAQTTVRVAVGAHPEGVQVEVSDQGPGISAELLDQIFERFARSKGSGGAAGLGLFFCRMVIERWGGAIAHEPAPGGGALFRFRLPEAVSPTT